MITIEEAWAHGRNCLAQASSSPDLNSRLLLQFVLGRGHSYLIAHGQVSLTVEEEELFLGLIQRAQQKEPIPYLTGSTSFFGLDFQVSSAVLIPRPETEQLVQLVLSWSADNERINIVDVGTGSGCIAVALAVHLRHAHISAVDISPTALRVARQNARKLAPERIIFFEGSLLKPLNSAVDVIVANLPYVADDEWTQVDDGVKWYEPDVALRGGADGLDLISELLQQATTKLRTPGAIFLEIGWRQGHIVKQTAQNLFPLAEINVVTDFAGHERFITIYTE